MDSDDLWGIAWILGIVFLFEMFDFDVLAKMVRKRIKPFLSSFFG